MSLIASVMYPTSHPAARRRGIVVLGLLALSVTLITSPARAQDEDLDVFEDYTHYADAPNAPYRHLARQAYERLQQRSDAVARLQTEAQWRRYQQEVRETLMDIVGPFPEKTPLNSRTVETLERDGYRVEKMLYESMPDFYVTAALFVPEGLRGKTPAIIYTSGHTAEGFRSTTYQHVILNLVRKGFIVLAIDPVGQGERLQYFDPAKGEPLIGGPTSQHSYVGAQAFISGSSMARYMIWDGIRAVDYLLGRDDVDSDRIGITGRSGGGTQSSYIAAFDDRIRAAAPENYITSFRRLLETRGPQDAEQNFYHGIARGIDHADLLAVRAPKPTLMITTTRDIFSIQGARETYREVERAYEAFGEADNFAMVEDDAGHASTPKNREAMYAFFQKHLNLPGSARDEEVDLFTPEELWVTETGQVGTSLGGETVFSLNVVDTQKRTADLAQRRKNLPAHLESIMRSARELSGYRAPTETPAANFFGRYQRDGYAVERYTIEGEGDYEIPFLLMVPGTEGPHPAAVYLHPEGKAVDAAPGGKIERLVKQGYVVLAPDLLNTGELSGGAYRGDSMFDGVSYGLWFGSVLVGRSLAGINAGDLVRSVRFLKGHLTERGEVDADAIAVVAQREAAPVALHAAAFEPAIARLALIEPLVSYRSVVTSREYAPTFIPNAVAGALTAYDLPDLAATLAPRKLVVINPLEGTGERAGGGTIDKDFTVVHSAYEAVGASDSLRVERVEDGEAFEQALSALRR